MIMLYYVYPYGMLILYRKIMKNRHDCRSLDVSRAPSWLGRGHWFFPPPGAGSGLPPWQARNQMLVSPMSLDLQLKSWVKAGAPFLPKNGMVIPGYTMLYHVIPCYTMLYNEHLRVQASWAIYFLKTSRNALPF